MDPRDIARFRLACATLAVRARAQAEGGDLVPWPESHWTRTTVATIGPQIADLAEARLALPTRRRASG